MKKISPEDGRAVIQQECQELFETFNRRFFDGRLPTYRIVLSNRYGNGNHGLCRKKEREIHLGTGLRGFDLKQRLLHEMAHAATAGGHGKQWLAEMLRLAEMGAPTREDWKAYQSPDQTIGLKEIAAEFYDAGVETDWPWSIVRSKLGKEYGLSDDRGRAESKSTAKVLCRFRKEFSKGRRWTKKVEIKKV